MSRRRLLEELQATDEPLGVARLAAAVGLHVTTARLHLQLLRSRDPRMGSRSPKRGWERVNS